ERFTESYEHMRPELVGNTRQILISELSGRGNVRLIASALSLTVETAEQSVLARIKELEQKGYKFEDAQGSVELMLHRNSPDYEPPFEVLETRVVVSEAKGHPAATDTASHSSAEAVVKMRVGNQVFHIVSEGVGPVHALDEALRKALLPVYPEIARVKLVDYKVRILDPDQATNATTRVVVEAADDESRWSTVGCSDNIIKASLQALSEGLELYLVRKAQALCALRTHQEIVA
ncbi:MAG: citramalate synthase, partial [Cyanobacteria bacterium]|nr:citramalate synthase [Cyanobacteriota bacterium]